MASIFSSLMDSIATDSFAWWFSRATLLAALACAYLALAQRARPAARHAVAVAGLCAIAFLPVASAVLPTLSVPVLPPSPVAAPTPPAARPMPFAIDAAVPEPTPAPMVAPVPASMPAPARPGVAPSAPVEPRKPGSAVRRAIVASTRNAVSSIDWTLAAVLTWLTVAFCHLSWMAMGAVGARRLSRRAASVADVDVLNECDRARRVLGIQRPIDVGVSSDVAIPMVVGALEPRVVLPISASMWSREKLRVVLLHELAHVRRRDCVWTLVCRLIASVFWFHPLVWVLSRHVRREAERACDELVLASGVRGSDYAEHLIDIARDAMARDPLAGSALAFATRSSLERRVVAILATRVPSSGTPRRAWAAAACGALAMFVFIAAARPTRVVSAQLSAVDAYDLVEAKHFDVYESAPVADSGEPVLAEAELPVETPAPMYYLVDDDERSGREWYSRATDLYNNRRFERAGQAYENAASRGYKTGTAYYNAGCSYALADQKGRAIDALKESVNEGFDRPDLFAEDSDLNSLRGDPRFQELLNEVMNSGSAESSRKAAKRNFERLAKASSPEDGEWNSVGIDLLRSGDYDGAALAFDNEFKVSHDEDALYNKACARSLAGKKDDALKLLEQSITTGSVDADHMQEDPDLVPLHDEPRFDQMIVMAEDLALHDGSWWKNLPGKSSWKGGSDRRRWQKSIPHFEEMTRKYPQVGRAWSNLGYAQLAAEDAKSSKPSFQKALDLGYRKPTTMYNLACACAQAGETDAAISWLEKAEGAGFEMWNYARWDDDLDPLRDDDRFEKMTKRWKAEAKKHGHDDWDWDWDDDDHDHDKDDDT